MAPLRCGVAPLIALLVAASSHSVAMQQSSIVGMCFSYRAVKGDSLYRIGGRFGVLPRTLAAINGFDREHRLRIGEELTVCNQHLVPQHLQDGILINIPQRMLFLFQDGVIAASYPVAVGRVGWQTPTGTFHVKTKVTNPTWYVPSSIQAEIEATGKRGQQKIPPSAENPLGKYWIGLDAAGFGIHGTNAPASIHQFQTHGCIRLLPEHVADLYNRVHIGTPVIIIYEPVLISEAQDAAYLEVHPDVYRRNSSARAEHVASLAKLRGLEKTIDWDLVRAELKQRSGLARKVSSQ